MGKIKEHSFKLKKRGSLNLIVVDGVEMTCMDFKNRYHISDSLVMRNHVTMPKSDWESWLNDRIWIFEHGQVQKTKVRRLETGERTCARLLAEEIGSKVQYAAELLNKYSKGLITLKQLRKKAPPEYSGCLNGEWGELSGDKKPGDEKLKKIPSPTRIEMMLYKEQFSRPIPTDFKRRGTE